MLKTFTQEQLTWLEKEIKNIIYLKNNDYIFNELCKFDEKIKSSLENVQKQFNIKLCHIGGYELMRDGTQTEQATSLEEFFYHFFTFCEYSEYNDVIDEIALNLDKLSGIQLYQKLENIWQDRFDDGGGNGWFELDPNTLFDESIKQEFLNAIIKQKS